MTSVDEYTRLVREGAAFDDARLVELREHMAPKEVQRVCDQLERDADAALHEADALREWNFPRRFPHAIVVDDYFGGCPECGKQDGCLNVGREHWFVCHEHKKRWSPGSNIFSGWREETEAKWAANFAVLKGYDETEPLMVGRWPRDPEARADVLAEWDFEKAWPERNRRVRAVPANHGNRSGGTAAVLSAPVSWIGAAAQLRKRTRIKYERGLAGNQS